MAVEELAAEHPAQDTSGPPAPRQRGTKRTRTEHTAWCDVPANLRNPLGETVGGITLKGPDGDAAEQRLEMRAWLKETDAAPKFALNITESGENPRGPPHRCPCLLDRSARSARYFPPAPS